MKEQSYLVIDIGSNAIRASYAIEDSTHDLEIIETRRFPIRLGEDVFKSGKISLAKKNKVLLAFEEISQWKTSINADKTICVATSAFRDAINSHTIIKRVHKLYNIKIKKITGKQEAFYIYLAVNKVVQNKSKRTLLIDIGGGSTEFSLIEKDKILYSKSFQCGTIRLLKSGKSEVQDKLIKKMILTLYKDLKNKDLLNDIKLSVGTGGNLKRMGKLRKFFFKRAPNKILQSELSAILIEISKLSIQERIDQLKMRRDRADVIIPAMKIVEQTLIQLDLTQIYLPKIGLKEGVILSEASKKINQIYFS